ncbi:MAG: YkgJ family cysteine cluster protein [Desulfobacterales bacterium]|nr:YkgJ family cysteine cluster protein [Desulfobacterales bacterium]
MVDSTPSPEEQAEQAQMMLKTRFETARNEFQAILEKHGNSVEVMAAVMNRWIDMLPAPPPETACEKGCAHCCYMGQEVSIPEALIVFHELKNSATPEGLAFFRDRIMDMDLRGDISRESWWREHKAACPFLDGTQAQSCLIYGIRPFSCRAYHSLDAAACRQGFEEAREVDVPCFPLLKKFTSLYSEAFIQATRARGLHSYGVGFVKAMVVLFQSEDVGDRWLAGEDVFQGCQFH